MSQNLEPLGNRERELFLQALEKSTPPERAAFLEGACRNDPTLRAAVDALLANANDPLLDHMAESARPTLLVPVTEQPGDRIGRYKLLQKIGEGGMGVVYMAEQEEPVHRQVALKIIKLGMDTRSVVARFEAERQALAMMDHPNIARVLDAGAKETGRPLFFGGSLPPNLAAPDAGLARYSDVQLYALALYLYSLKPPPNPNLPKTAEQRALVERGREVFDREDCVRCHKPPLYTNNKLTPARGFKVPDNHPAATNIMSKSVGTDPTLATQTRRGTGYYKVPSLLGVWYRGPFEHNGSCATLETLHQPFLPRRLAAVIVGDQQARKGSPDQQAGHSQPARISGRDLQFRLRLCC